MSEHLHHLEVNVFLERVALMPDVEAREEIIKRKETLLLERGVIQTRRQELAGLPKHKIEFQNLGRELEVMGADQGTLANAHVALNRRMDINRWANAVKAVFGEDGYVQCRIWMIQNDPETPDVRAAIKSLIAKYPQYGLEVAA